MTAQSFAEAFDAPPLTDAAESLLAAAERIKSLDAWVVALENRIEKALDLCALYSSDAYGYDKVAATLNGVSG